MKSKQANNPNPDLGTEAKIKEAARRVFLKFGYYGSKTRDIAEEAGVNLALVNYYFRSKDKLFEEVFAESLFIVSKTILSIFDDDLPLEVKIYKVSEKYTELFLKDPDLPLFIVNEMQRRAAEFYPKMGMAQRSGIFAKQLKDEAEKGNIRPITTFHLEQICAALIMFPFMSRPVAAMHGLEGVAFEAFVRERQKMVPELVMAYLRKKD